MTISNVSICYLYSGLGNACAGQVRDTACSRRDDTKPIIAVENLGKVVPIGAARFIALLIIMFLAWPGLPSNFEGLEANPPDRGAGILRCEMSGLSCYLKPGLGLACAGHRRAAEALLWRRRFSVASEENLGAVPPTGSLMVSVLVKTGFLLPLT